MVFVLNKWKYFLNLKKYFLNGCVIMVSTQYILFMPEEQFCHIIIIFKC